MPNDIIVIPKEWLTMISFSKQTLLDLLFSISFTFFLIFELLKYINNDIIKNIVFLLGIACFIYVYRLIRQDQ